VSDVFVSYARKNKARVTQIVTALKAAGFSVWWDDDLPWGESYDDQIARALTEARCVLVVWSAESVASRWVRDEATMARDLNKMFPVRIADVRLPLGHYREQALDLFGEPIESNADWGKVLDGLAGGKGAGQTETDRPRSATIRWRDLAPAALLLAGVIAGVVVVSNGAQPGAVSANDAAEALQHQVVTLAPTAIALLASFGFSAFRARG
jgi:hypothetical protein